MTDQQPQQNVQSQQNAQPNPEQYVQYPQQAVNQAPDAQLMAGQQQPLQSGYQQVPDQPLPLQQPLQDAPQPMYQQGVPGVPPVIPAAPMQAPIPQFEYIPQIPAPEHKNYNGFAIAGLVLGLIAVIGALWSVSNYINPFGIVGLALSIIGFATTSQPDEGKKLSQAQRVGRIFSIAGIIICVIALIVTLVVGIFHLGYSSYRTF